LGVYGIAIDIHNNCPIHKHKHAQVCYSPLMFTSDEPHQNTCTHDGRHKMRHKTFSPHATLAFTHIPVHTIRQTHEKLEAQNLSPHATLAYKHTYVRTQNVKHRKSLRHKASAINYTCLYTHIRAHTKRQTQEELEARTFSQSCYLYSRTRFPPPMAARQYIYARRV
jgi:hypothetical protein